MYVFAQKAGFDAAYPAELKKPLDVSLKEISVPPITRNPEVLKIDNQFQISLEVFMPKEEKESYISKVWIDLSPLGGEKEFLLKLKEGSIYSTLIPLEITKKSLLKVYAQSNTGALSYDYIILE
ncbi:MAG: hypothetical protein HYU63_07385 [Armatimonadetes bacterium]|nr:hypothetical protein [Armatimonadota bacterium]